MIKKVKERDKVPKFKWLEYYGWEHYNNSSIPKHYTVFKIFMGVYKFQPLLQNTNLIFIHHKS